MKKIASFIVMVLLFDFLMPMYQVFALTTNEVRSYNGCSNGEIYEIAIANPDGSLTHQSCHLSYVEGKSVLDASTNDDAVLLEHGSDYNRIIDAKYAIANLNYGSELKTYYRNETGNESVTYMNNTPTYYGVDAALIERAANGRAKVKISNVTAWLNDWEYEVVPLVWVKSTNLYSFSESGSDSAIWHCYTKDIRKDRQGLCLSFGPKPPQVETGEYYSFDGKYFYRDRKSMLQDYKNDTYERAVNKDNPYYNYYMYLPNHSKTTYSSQNIDEYIRNVLGKKGTGYWAYPNSAGYWWVPSDYSMLYGQGTFFYNAQEKYGVNALLMFAVAQNESATGTSKISFDKNNGFGHGAVDSDPYQQSDGYLTFSHGIYAHAYRWITYGYGRASDWRYHGNALGNKGIGMNVQYASDPYWGEKAASNYYDFDIGSGGGYDYNYYQLAVSTAGGVSVRTAPDLSSRILYTTNSEDNPVIVIDEVQGPSVYGNTTWYKIIADMNLDANQNEIPYNNSARSDFDWDHSYAYVSSYYFKKVNQPREGIKNPNQTYAYADQDYTYDYYISGENLAPKVAMTNKNTEFYHDPVLTSKRGITVEKDTYLMVYAEARDKDGTVKSYLASSDYTKNQREWINASDLRLVEKSYGKVNISLRNTWEEIYNAPKGTMYSSGQEGLFNRTFIPILDKSVVDGVTWLKIPYQLSGSNRYAWVMDQNAANSYYMEYTKVVTYPPEINAENKTILINSAFDPLKGVSVSDKEDGEIPVSKLKVTNNVVTSKTGSYTVVYEVTDSEGNKATKTITVTVVDYQEKEGFFYFESLTHKQEDQFEVSGFLAVSRMHNAKGETKHTFILKNVDTNQEYRFPVSNWASGYPFEMSNVDDDQTYNYNGGWFKGTVDLKNVPAGNYNAYIEVQTGIYRARTLFNNLAFKEMTRRVETSKNRGYYIEMNYYDKTTPLDIFIRTNGLIAKSTPPTIDLMFNFFTSLNFTGNALQIRGMSHNVGIDYSNKQEVERSIILENTKTFEQKIYSNIGSILNGDYKIELAAPDGKDKTRAWYNASLDISSLAPGVYTIYVKTKVGTFEDFGELNDISYSTVNQTTTIGNKRYSLRRADDKRFRIELVVE